MKFWLPRKIMAGAWKVSQNRGFFFGRPYLSICMHLTASTCESSAAQTKMQRLLQKRIFNVAESYNPKGVAPGKDILQLDAKDLFLNVKSCTTDSVTM